MGKCKFDGNIGICKCFTHSFIKQKCPPKRKALYVFDVLYDLFNEARRKNLGISNLWWLLHFVDQVL